MIEDEIVGWHHRLNGQSLSRLWDLLMDREAWHAAVHGVTKSRTRLRDWTEVFVLCIEVLLWWAHTYLELLCLPLWLIPWSLCSVFPYLLWLQEIFYFILRSILIWECYSSFILLPICMEYIFPSSHFQSICVFRSEVGFLQRAYIWVLFFYPLSQSVSLGWSI